MRIFVHKEFIHRKIQTVYPYNNRTEKRVRLLPVGRSHLNLHMPVVCRLVEMVLGIECVIIVDNECEGLICERLERIFNKW